MCLKGDALRVVAESLGFILEPEEEAS